MNCSSFFRLFSVSAIVFLRSTNLHAQPTEAATELERFMATESALARSGETLPTSRPVYSVFGDQSILNVPRSVTVLTPELMSQAGIANFADLSRLGAGTQQINFYGVPGTPTLRGAKGSVYFDGMQRGFQRNEMPLSFGSLEAMDVVKGPAPAQFGPGLVGGYVNLIPKSPYFDKNRGSLTAEIGEYHHYRIQIDSGGPVLIAGKPAAYRISLTAQQSDSYYDRIGNNFVSLYGSIKARVAENVSIFTGGEYFNYKSNENAGWNRPTQRLIDSGQYVVGEPLSIASSAWGGAADRTVLSKSKALVVPATIVDAGVASGFINAAQQSALLNLLDPTQRAQAYSSFSAAQLAGIAQSTSGYEYTPSYFAAGGRVFTQKIRGNQILSDNRDYANSKNLLYFFDLENSRNQNITTKGQFLLDYIDTDKLSTYGYAISTDQLVLEAKGTAVQKLDLLSGMTLTYGVSARFTDAKMLQDFSVEPFSRRDATLSQISGNSVILSGPQRGPDGKNFWTATSQGGANAHSKLWQFSLFSYAENKITSALSIYTSALIAYSPYKTAYPSEVDLVPATDSRRTPFSDHRNYYSVSVSPVYTLVKGLNLYATAQRGTALDPLQGGAIVDKNNFSENRLLEVGLKTSLLNETWFASVSAFRWKQTRFDDRSGVSEPLKGKGIELESTYAPSKTFSLIGSIDFQRVQRESTLGFRSVPLSEQDWALNAGVLTSNFAGTVAPPAGGTFGRPANNATLIYPGTPETQLKLFAIFHFQNGFGLSGGPIWSDSYWHNFDHTLKLPRSLVWNGSVFFHTPRYEITLSIDNITNEDYFEGAEPVFGANTLITKAPQVSGKVTLTCKF